MKRRIVVEGKDVIKQGLFSRQVRFLKDERGVTVRAADGETLYIERPKIRLERGIRSWLRVLEGWATGPRRGRLFVKVILEYLATADILGTVKKWIFSILPERFGACVRIGNVLEFSLVWTA